MPRYHHKKSADQLSSDDRILQATERLLEDPNYNHEYLTITGLPEFTSAAAKLILGADSPAIAEGRVTSVQTISGTGANHLAGLFINKFYAFNGPKQIYLPNPTWGKRNATFLVLAGTEIRSA